MGSLMRGRGFLAVVLIGFSFPICCLPQSKPWKQVQDLTHHATFTFIDTAHLCTKGKIRRVTDNELVVNTGKSNVSLARANLLWILRGIFPSYVPPYGGSSAVIQTVYSARSSWSDVTQFGRYAKSDVPGKYPHIRVLAIVTDNIGKKHQGLLVDVTADAVTLKQGAKKVVFRKSDIASFAVVREKPLGDGAEYCWDEAIGFEWLCPEVYPRMFHVGDSIDVNLYDFSLPEDNSPMTCK
jgi:hypothetical protein